MAKLEITQTGVWVRLSVGEKIMAFRGDLLIPATRLRGAEVQGKGWWKQLGLRVPGTGIPGLAIYGTYIRPKRRDFVAWHRGQEVVRLNLSGKGYSHVFIGTKDAAALVDEINEALTAC